MSPRLNYFVFSTLALIKWRVRGGDCSPPNPFPLPPPTTNPPTTSSFVHFTHPPPSQNSSLSHSGCSIIIIITYNHAPPPPERVRATSRGIGTFRRLPPPHSHIKPPPPFTRRHVSQRCASDTTTHQPMSAPYTHHHVYSVYWYTNKCMHSICATRVHRS